MPLDPRFLNCVFEPDDLVEIRIIPKGGSRFVKASCLADLDEYLASENNDGKNIYVGANPRKRKGGKAADVLLARCLFVDIDKATVEEAERRIAEVGLPEPTCFVSSGHGVHAYWRLTEPMRDPAQWTECQRHLIGRLDSDGKIHDPPRVMRLPGFTNPKPPAAECSIIEAKPDRRYEIGDLVSTNGSVAEKQRVRSHISDVSALSAPSATVERVICEAEPKHEITDKQRNACLMTLARGLKFNAGLASTNLSSIKEHVRAWHRRAVPYIGTKDCDTSWADFLRAWKTARIPLLVDLIGPCLEKARQQAENGDLPPCADQFDLPIVRLLVGLCANLSALTGGDGFFLSSHEAAKRRGGKPGRRWNSLYMLDEDGVIMLEEKGNAYRANRYRWIGGKVKT